MLLLKKEKKTSHRNDPLQAEVDILRSRSLLDLKLEVALRDKGLVKKDELSL